MNDHPAPISRQPDEALPVCLRFFTSYPTYQRILFCYPDGRGDTAQCWVAVRAIEWDVAPGQETAKWLLRGLDLYQIEERLFVMEDMRDVSLTI